MLLSKFDLYKREWLDLVFADRNQAYGAYDLRVHYGDNMLKALAMTIAGFTVAAVTLTLVFQHKRDVAPVVIPKDHITTVYIPPPVIEKPKLKSTPESAKPVDKPLAPPKTNSSTINFTVPKPTNDPVNTVPPTITELDGRVISNTTQEGTDKNPQNMEPGTQAGKPGGQGTSAGTGDEIVPVGGLDAFPQPVGGEAAWSKFLNKNLRYPDTEDQGRVILSFVVEKDGRLTDITVVKSVSPQLDAEALRVLKKAAAWKPGTQNGQPVRVRFTVPFVFQKVE